MKKKVYAYFKYLYIYSEYFGEKITNYREKKSETTFKLKRNMAISHLNRGDIAIQYKTEKVKLKSQTKIHFMKLIAKHI